MHAVCYLTWESKRLSITARTPSKEEKPKPPAHNSAQTKHFGWGWGKTSHRQPKLSPSPPRLTWEASAQPLRGRNKPAPMRQGRARA